MRLSTAAVALLAIALTAVFSGCPGSHRAPGGRASYADLLEARRHNWRGIAFLERYDYQGAAQEFRAALAVEGTYAPALTNLGLACYYLGGPELDEARQVLTQALEAGPDNHTAQYALALVELQTGDRAAADRAIDLLERLSDSQPKDDVVWAQLGLAYERREMHGQARSAFERAVELNPNNATAHWRLGQLLLLQGERDEALAHLRTHEELSKQAEALALGTKYGEVGTLGLAVHEGAPPTNARLPLETTFSDTAPLRTDSPAALDVAWLDFDADDDADLLAVMADEESPVCLYRNEGEGRLRPADCPMPPLNWRPSGVVVADLERPHPEKDSLTDAQPREWPPSYPDAFVYGPEQAELWQNDHGRRFVRGRRPQSGSWPGCRSASFVDYDHDGDLDLALASTHGSLRLYRNAGGEFSEVTREAGLGAVSASSIVCLDVDTDRAIDMVVGGELKLLRNNWDGTFRDVTGAWGLDALPTTSGIAATDLDANGKPDLVVLSGKGEKVVVHALGGPGELTTTEIAGGVSGPGTGDGGPQSVLAGDFDNDGLTDIAAAHPGSGLTLFRNLGDRFEDVTETVGLGDTGPPGLGDAAAGDYDSDGDLDFALAAGDGVHLLHNETPSSRNWLHVRLAGIHSNSGGVGAKVELFCADGQAAHFVTASSGGAAGAVGTVHFGLGRSSSADWVRVTWPSGIVQSEIDLPAGERVVVRELDRKPTSCPVLYAHDGRQMAFLTDCLGNAIIGYLLARGEYCPWDPDEYVRVPGNRLGEHKGQYHFELADQLEEVLFIDHLKLLCVDHPPGTEVYSADLMKCGPPYPHFELYGIEQIRPVCVATDSRGRDVTRAIVRADREYVEDFDMLPGLEGYATPHALTLGLGDLGEARDVWLLVQGYLEYAHSSSNLAASQCGVEAHPPRLEVGDGKGGWRLAREDAGLIAGLTKEIAIRLTPDLRLDDPRVRIRTDMPWFIDRVRVGVTRSDVPVDVREARLAGAEYHWLGYPRPGYPKGKNPAVYDYSQRCSRAPWQTPLGEYTAPGEVRALLAGVDDSTVIMRHGYSISMRFDVVPTKPKQSRTYFLYVYGVGKDMDMNGAFANTVAPLPYRDMPGYQPGALLGFPWTRDRAALALAHQALDQSGPCAAPAVANVP